MIFFQLQNHKVIKILQLLWKLNFFIIFSVSWIWPNTSFKIDSPKIVKKNDIFEIKVILENRSEKIKIYGSNFDFLRQSGVLVSKTLIKGKFSEKKIYSYRMKPRNLGVMRLTVQVGDDQKKIRIKVVKPSINRKPSTQLNPKFYSPNSLSKRKSKSSKDLVLVRNRLSKKKLLVNETAQLETIFYFNLPIENFRILKRFNQGCYQLIQTHNFNSKRKTTILNGKKYLSKVILKHIIYGQKKGICTIEEINFRLTVVYSSFLNKKIIDIKSPKVKFKVIDYPKRGQPHNFNFHYGDYHLGLNLSTLKPEENTPIKLAITISGAGNFIALNEPEILNPSPFLTLVKDKVIDSYQPKGNALVGSKTYYYYLTPNKIGYLKDTPKITFNYYSPTTKSYVRLKKKIPNLEVTPYLGYNSLDTKPTFTNSLSTSQEIWRQLYSPATKELPYPFFSNKEIFAWYHLIGILASSLLFLVRSNKKNPLTTVDANNSFDSSAGFMQWIDKTSHLKKEYLNPKVKVSTEKNKSLKHSNLESPWLALKNQTALFIQKLYSLKMEKSLDKEITNLIRTRSTSSFNTDSRLSSKEIEILKNLCVKINQWEKNLYSKNAQSDLDTQKYSKEIDETVFLLKQLLSFYYPVQSSSVFKKFFPSALKFFAQRDS